MTKIGKAIEALQAELAQLDEMGQWAAAAHVSMAISLLYDGSSARFKVSRIDACSPAISVTKHACL
ncbi:hypothetical protein LPN01_14605 [Sphingomonas sp. A2-49]|uniref:hypothetical protein n=1 Tax=Sphingomonas sp. A2-49 TaxID=1391375 RepID=UPI0021CE3867|nr:hypothetical protein [Sphingomonas sp. A2-49]MCU6455311.1 hypothetical protein [Sphingomonas sp. A2-49]